MFMLNIRPRMVWPVLLVGLMLYRNAAAQLPDFTELVEKYGEAVVNVSTTQKQPEMTRQDLPENLQIPEGTPLDELFRRFLEDPNRGFRPPESKSLGSGFIISPDGYILTNHHVVMDAQKIIVRMRDRRELEAKVIGSDKRSDVALIKVNAENLPVVKIGSAQNVKVGEWVLAIGSPFGFDHSVTAGIVSAKGRSLPSDNYVSFIQTDVAINPGNSGGPLFNLKGEVVGINSQIYSRTGGFMGLSFAIPMEVAINVADQLKQHGEVSRGWLGVQIQDVTRELAESFGMKVASGALVSRVISGSPAEKAGFQVGDVIIEFNGHQVDTSADLPPLVGMTPVGQIAPAKIIRQGEEKTLAVDVGLLTEAEGPQPTPSKSDNVSVDRLGIIVSDLTPEQREELQMTSNGVLVQQVKEGPAHDAGLQRGDVILGIQNLVVENAESLDQTVKALPAGRSVALLVQRSGSPVFLALKIEK